MAEHRIQLGDEFRIAAFSSVVVQMRARVLVEFDNGRLREFNVKLTTTSDLQASSETFGNLEANGRVVRAIVARITPATINRGQCYVILNVRDRNGVTVDQLAGDYLFETNNLSLDRYQSSLSGQGHLSWRTVSDDIAPADVTEVLAAANTRRRVYGFIWYYHASNDAASRTLIVQIRAAGTIKPTGYSLTAILNNIIGTVTLTADQEGIVYGYKGPGGGDGYGVSNDNDAALDIANAASAPAIWPIEVEENDLIELFFNQSSGNANDRMTIQILQEEWIDV